MDIRATRNYQARCAVCSRPTDGECIKKCETTQLNYSLEEAENRWLKTWREQTREWVAHNAVKYVTQSFEALKEARLAAFTAEVRAIPYYDLYEQCRGRPPLPPHLIEAIEQRISAVQVELYQMIDRDWKNCVNKYPEVLGHYFSLVNLTLPREVEPPANIIPKIPTSSHSPTKTRSISGGSQKKSRRVSVTMPPPAEADEQALETMSKVFAGQKLSGGHKPRGGRASPVFEYPTKLPGKKRLPATPEYALSGGVKRYPRAPTAPPTAGGPWKAPPPGY